MSPLADRIVVVTGASSGIGEATARRLAADGATVVVTARRKDRLDRLVADITNGGGRAVAIPADVTKSDEIKAVVARAIDQFGRIDIMICNAGIGYHGTLDETPPAHMRRVVDVNLLGTLYAAGAVLPHMRRRGQGHIIVVSSIVGRRGIPGSSVYGATKAAQIGFVEALRAEFVGTNLHASVVLPVATTTEFHAAISRDFGHDVEGHGPRQSPETVADAIAACIVAPRPEVYPLRKSRWLGVLNVLAPGRTDRLVRRFGRRRIAQRPATDDG